VALKEPDVVAEGNGLQQPLALACKSPSSVVRLQELITEDNRQIATHGIRGAVSTGMDVIVGQAAELGERLDFRASSRPPLEGMSSVLTGVTDKLIADRPVDYPAESQLDGLVLTLKMAGIYGSPADLVLITSATLRCLPGNPLLADLETVVRALNGLNAERA
jgi:hypothetical protein